MHFFPSWSEYKLVEESPPPPNTNKNMDSKDNEYNPDENTHIALKKGWGGRVWSGQKQFSSK